MLKYFKVNEEDRICFTSDNPYSAVKEDGEVVTEGEQFDFPEDFDFLEQHNYKIIDGELVYDPAPESEEVVEPTWQDSIEAQVTYTAMMTDTLLEV